MWPFSSRKSKIQKLEAFMSERFNVIAAQLMGINAEVRKLQTDNADKTRLILDAQDRINALESALAEKSSEVGELNSIHEALAEIERLLSHSAEPAPVEPAPVDLIPAPQLPA